MPLRVRLLLPIALVAAAVYVGLVATLGDLRPHGHLVAGATLCAGLPLAALAHALWQWRGRTRAYWLYVVVGATLLRLPLLFITPSLSDDVYRYVWDGHQQRHGVNPYRYPPGAEQMAHLRDPLWERVNHKHVPTIYPPLAELCFLAADAVSHSVRSQKLLVLAFDVALIFALGALCDARKLPRARVVLYAWHPLVLLEVAGNAHNDSLPLFFLVLGLWLAAVGRGGWSLLALAASTLSKFVGGVAAPLVARRMPPKYWLVFPVAVALGYAPYAGAGLHVFEGLHTYAAHWEFNHGLFRAMSFVLLHLGVADPRLPIKIVFALGGALLLAWLTYRRADPVRGTCVWIAYALLTSPTVHPWYVVWCVPFLVCVRSWGLLGWSLTVALAYHVMPAFAAEGVWRERIWLVWLEYLPVYALLLAELLPLRSRRL